MSQHLDYTFVLKQFFESIYKVILLLIIGQNLISQATDYFEDFKYYGKSNWYKTIKIKKAKIQVLT